MSENINLVQRGFRILLPYFSGYIAQEMRQVYQDDWWQEALIALGDQARDLPKTSDYNEQLNSLDIASCIRLFERKWNDVFRRKLSLDYRTWAKELMGVRNKTSHAGTQDYSESDTWRALDTMARLCEAFDDESAEEIRTILREFRYGAESGSTSVDNAATEMPQAKKGQQKETGILSDPIASGLPSWRTIIEPHPDVAQGRYKKAEFAVDLNQIAHGKGEMEYADPVEFFARTYVTEGMKGLLVQGLKRLGGQDGEPVIQLKTAFGGGKTHSMLALYHLMRGTVSSDKLPNIKPVMEEAGINSLPRVNVAVLVGSAMEPAKSRRPLNMPGITINTMWGEMAAQLAESAGDLSLYDYIKESDKRGTSPGSDTLRELFDACGPCLILMDELVAYARVLHDATGLPAGTYDNFIVFIQAITEAARASKNSMVVASIPESDIEIGGEAGRIALDAIEHTFGRMEAIWKPVAANEGFEVVRRRLFLNCKDEEKRNEVCRAFSNMYNENSGDFPTEAKEVEYRDRMASCYPIHPEVFDRLYEDWATLDKFQRTRGVLRLMAAVIHELWMGADASPMIMPGSIALNNPSIKDELIRYLPEGWNSIVDNEVDGKDSVPYQKDQANPRYGQKLAARRVARTIMLGSAPTDRSQSVRGIEASRIRLGVVQPGESIADFNDAMNTLQTSLAYLYTNSSGDRYWYDTRPTLRKTVEDRATQVSLSDVEYEIEQRLRKLRKEEPFGGLHVCPNGSLDVPDEQSARLIVLKPEYTFKASKEEDNVAVQMIRDILNNRGNSPRMYKNMLAFVAPDMDGMSSLQSEVRRYNAWKSVLEDKDELNLDVAQIKEAENSIKRSNETVDMRLNEAYCWLFVPLIDRAVDIKEITLDRIRISGNDGTIVSRSASHMKQQEHLITKWAPALLLMELDNLLWKDANDISVKTLWEQLCTYCYLPRLANISVLEETIREGVNSTEYFALAGGKTDARYIELKYNQYAGMIDPASSWLVKIVTALKQIQEEQAETIRTGAGVGTGVSGAATGTEDISGGASPVVPGFTPDGDEPADTSGQTGGAAEPEKPKNTRFIMSASLDNTRVNRDVQNLVQEVINHLSSVEGSTVEISLDVFASMPNGTPPATVRTVLENCQTLKVRDFGFED